MTTSCNSRPTFLWDAVFNNQIPAPIKDFFEAQETGYWDWNIADKTFTTNQSWHSMIGEECPAAALPYQCFIDKIHTDDRDAALQKFAEIQGSSQQPFQVEFRLKCSDNSYKWIRSNGIVAERDSQGVALRIIGRHEDIDQHKRCEIALQGLNSFKATGNQREVLNKLCQTVGTVFDASYVAITNLVNKDGVEWARVSGEWKAGESALDAEFSIKETPFFETAEQGYWITNSDVQNAFPAVRGFNKLNASSYAGIRLHDRSGAPIALLSIISHVPINKSLDVLEILKLTGKRAELKLQRFELVEELRKARKIAEQAAQSKKEFLTNMSHEIRNPMTTILGYAELLGSDSEFEADALRSVDAIEAIKKCGHQLLGTINEILDASKIDSGDLIVEPVLMDPIQVVESVCKELRPRAVEQSIEFNIKYINRIPQQIYSDPKRLKQSLYHLIDNAIKFTERGSVTVAVSCRKCSDYDNVMVFDIIDTGIGLTAEQQQHVESYQPFAQVDGSSSRQHGGIGLGLRITNSLASMLGGGIEIYSRKNAGSTFSLSVSAGSLNDVNLLDKNEIEKHIEQLNSPVESAAEINEAPLHGKRILIAEDGKDNQKLISYHLVKSGAEVVVAENGKIALDEVAEAERRAENFHIILMDMQMPEIDGYSATRTLREQGYKLPVIALTANAMDDDRLKCIVAGCDDYISKPIDGKSLINLCCEYVEGNMESSENSPLELV